MVAGICFIVDSSLNQQTSTFIVEMVLFILLCAEIIALLVEIVLSIKKKYFKPKGKVANEDLKKIPSIDTKKTF